jgi:hypothetical protein
MVEPQILRPFTLPAVPRRPADGHKGTFGKILVVGCSAGWLRPCDSRGAASNSECRSQL